MDYIDNYQLSDNIIIIYIAYERRNFCLQVRSKPGHPNATWHTRHTRSYPIGYPLTARSRDQFAPVYTRVLPINLGYMYLYQECACGESLSFHAIIL